MPEPLEKQVNRINEKLTTLLKEVKSAKETKPLWVKASMIEKATGWNAEKRRQMKNNGLLVQKRDGYGIFYDLRSIDPVFIINPVFAR